MAAKIGSLLIDLHANVASLQKDFSKAQKTMDGALGKMGKALKSFAGLASAYLGGRAILNFANQTLVAATEIKDLADRTGLAAESLSALRYGAENSGASLQNLERGLKNISEWSTQAAAGNETYAKKFERFGITIQTASGALRPTEEILGDISDKLASIPPGAARLEAAMRLVGVEAGPKLLPMLSEGRAGLEKFRQEAESLGMVLSTDAAIAAAEFDDNLNRMRSAVQGAGFSIMNEMLPALQMWTDRIVGASREVGGLRDVVKTGFRLVSSAVTIVGAIFESVGKRIAGVAATVWALMRGEWGEAWQTAKLTVTDQIDIIKESLDDLDQTWSGATENVKATAPAVGSAIRSGVVAPFKQAKREAKEAGDTIAEQAAKIRAELGMGADEKFGTEVSQAKMDEREGREFDEGWHSDWREKVEPTKEDDRITAEAGASWAMSFAQGFASALKDGDAFGMMRSALSGLGSLLGMLIPGVGGILSGGILGIGAGLFASGGHVTGPGGPTDDQIPAMLSNGEYVLKAAVVDQLGVSTLDALNQGRVPAFAEGGLVGGRRSGTASPSVTVNVSAFSPADTQRAVRQVLGPSFPRIREARQSARMLGSMSALTPRYG